LQGDPTEMKQARYRHRACFHTPRPLRYSLCIRAEATSALELAVALNRTNVNYRLSAAEWYNTIDQPDQALEARLPTSRFA
jgi:hypothetical protein